MLCRICGAHNRRPRSGVEVWAELPCVSITKQAIKRHAKSTMHKDAILMEAEARSSAASGGIVGALSSMARQEKMAIIGAMKCLYWLAEEEMPHTTKYHTLLAFCKSMGCSYLDNMDLGKNAHYTSERVVQEMLETMGGMIRDKVLQETRSSPVYSLLIDETTDISILKQLITYGRYVSEGKVKTSFIGLTAIPNGTAETIQNAILGFLTESEIPLEKMRGFGSDGANVMVGSKNGVATLLKRANPKVTNIHCVAHRLALGVGQAAQGIPYMKKFKDLLQHMFHFYENSAVRMAGLVEIENLLGDPKLKLQEAKDVRWLSHQKAVAVIKRILPSIISSLEYEGSERGDPSAVGLAKFVRTFDFVATVCMLCDVLPHLSGLSLVFQKSEVDFTMVDSNIAAVKAVIEGYMERPGDNYQGLEEWLEGDLEVFKIEWDESAKETFQRTVYQPFLSNLLTNLQDRFGDAGILKNYCFLDPQQLGKLHGEFLDGDQKEQLRTVREASPA